MGGYCRPRSRRRGHPLSAGNRVSGELRRSFDRTNPLEPARSASPSARPMLNPMYPSGRTATSPDPGLLVSRWACRYGPVTAGGSGRAPGPTGRARPAARGPRGTGPPARCRPPSRRAAGPRPGAPGSRCIAILGQRAAAVVELQLRQQADPLGDRWGTPCRSGPAAPVPSARCGPRGAAGHAVTCPLSPGGRGATPSGRSTSRVRGWTIMARDGRKASVRRSTMRTRAPRSAAWRASARPVGPAPTTRTSGRSFMRRRPAATSRSNRAAPRA